MDQTRAARFGEIVKERRKELGLTQVQIGTSGGPSAPTLQKIEAGADPTISARTLNNLDKPLRWAEGSAARTLAGGNPTVLQEPEGATEQARPLVLGPDVIEISDGDLTDLLVISHRLNDGFESCRQRAEVEPLERPIAEFNKFVTRVAGAYATILLERNGGPGAKLHPLVELAVAHLLDAPIGNLDADATEEARYRRWLAGRLLDVDKDTEVRFRLRHTFAMAERRGVSDER